MVFKIRLSHPGSFALAALIQLSSYSVPLMAQACFLADGKIMIPHPTTSARNGAANIETVSAKPLSAVWGTLADGRVVATHRDKRVEDADAVEGHSDEAAGSLVSVAAGGSVETLLTSDVLRAFVSPGGDAIAAITPARELVLWRSGKPPQTISAPGKVSHVAWSPDGARLAAAVYPPEYSPHAMDNPRDVEQFIHLQNSDIYLFDANSGALNSQLTTSPGTDYNPFFSPDGTQLYYVWLHERENLGGLMRLTLDRDNGTSASSPAVQVTQAGADAGHVPLGRVGTYLFAKSGAALVFEAGRPDGSGEVWSMRADGKSAAFIAEGRKPQRLIDGTIAILTPENNTRALTTAEVSR